MKTDSIPANPGQLILLGEKMQVGVTKYGQTLPIVLVTANQVGTDTAAFATADGAFNAGRSAVQTASNAHQATLEPLYDWLLAVSNMLASRYGTRWNTEWAQAGFINHSTAIPSTIADRLLLALSLVQYFTTNPSFEVPSMNLTAAKGTALRSATLTTQGAVATAEIALKGLGDVWETAHAKLVATMRDLIHNLESKLSESDNRWLAFGLRIPSSVKTPGQPVNVSAHPDETGAIIVQCDAVPLATRYRWRVQVVDVDKDYQLAASTTGPLGSITEIDPGRLVRIIVQAVNGSLQGVASEPLEYRIPPAATKTTSTQAPKNSVQTTGTALLGHSNGNGHRNGNGRSATVHLS